MSPDERLVYMANQIATFFASQPGDEQAARVADHLRAFWEPRMRRAIIARLDAGDAALSPLTAQAVALLRAPTAEVATALAHDHAPSAKAPGDDAG